MLGDNPVANAEAKSGSLADGFRGVKRIEDARGVLYSRAGIRKFNEHLIAFDSGMHPDFAGRALFEDGIHRVIDEVQKNLLQLVRIGGDLRKILRQIKLELDLAHAKVIVAEAQSIFDDLFEANYRAFWFVLTREA